MAAAMILKHPKQIHIKPVEKADTQNKTSGTDGEGPAL
jgi:hypothetical protein